MFNKIIVSAYKIAGFGILTGILVGLASYVFITMFYFTSTSWLAPVIVSPSDARILELNEHLAQQQSLRDALSAQRAEMVTKLRDAERMVVAETGFQGALIATLRSDLRDRRATIAKLDALRRDYKSVAGEVAAANHDFAGLSKDQMKAMFDARIATKEEVVKGNMELANLASTNITLAERRVMLDEQVVSVQRQAESLATVEGLVAPGASRVFVPAAFSFGGGSGIVPTHDVLLVQREYEVSILATKRAQEEGESIKQAIAAADSTLTRYDALLKSIEYSPYLRAIDQHMTIAFVPYTNLDSIKRGAPLYGCRANIVWCKRVGRVGVTLDGEVTGSHPLQKIDLRGVMVQLELDDIRSAQNVVVHSGRAPMFF